MWCASGFASQPLTSSEHDAVEKKTKMSYAYKRKLMTSGSLFVVRSDFRETSTK
jgi:hypothetical protein